MTTRGLSLTVLLIMAWANAVAISAPQEQSADEPKVRFFEQRVYTTHPGKLAELHQRFRNHTNRLFEKHGMDLIGYWTPVDGEAAENTLLYILAYPSREARDASWDAFREDPEWQAVYAESRRNGPIVMKVESTFLAPTDYSRIK